MRKRLSNLQKAQNRGAKYYHGLPCGHCGLTKRDIKTRKCFSCIKERNWTNKIKYRYGLTPDTYAEILTGQNNLCAICKTDSDLVIDHDHVTNKVRGFLCNNCNVALGMFKDSVMLLKSGIKYLMDAK